MKPRLYKAGESEFISNGMGPLSEAQSCKVEEARNGAFELTMEYPVTGELFEEVKNSAIILAKPNETAQPQPFRIYKIEKPFGGVVTVRAKHISYQLSHIPVAPFSARSCQAALQGLKINAAENCPFDFWTDKETVAEFAVKEPASIRSALGGVQGSVLDCYGGEYEFDRYTVKLHKDRGRDSGVVIAYGKNLTDLNQEESIENTITGIYPYYKDSDGNILELPEKVVRSDSAAAFPYPRTIPLDCSQQWKETPTVEQLRDYAQSYVKGENIGVPSVSLKVSFVALWQTEEYKDVAPAERLALCDTATVRFSKLGVDAKAKVVAYVYDVMAERYDSVTLGEASTNLADKIVEQGEEVKKKTSTSYLEKAVERATSWITGNKGGYVLLRKNADEQPNEILIMDAPEIEKAVKVWRWNNGGLGFSENGYNGPYRTAITQGGEMVADFMTTGNLTANIIRTGVLQDVSGKNFFFDLISGVLRANFSELSITGIPVATVDKAKDLAEEKAKEELEAYDKTMATKLVDLQSQIDGQITSWFYPFSPALDNEPAKNWTTEKERENHAGDLFYDTEKGYAYRFAKKDAQWAWLSIVDTDVVKALADAKAAQDTADGKRRTFITDPVPPYDAGDIWTQGTNGEIKVCTKGRTSGSYAQDDWTAAANYINATDAEKIAEGKAKAAADSALTTLTQADIFNRLTNNGALKGIYIKNGDMYINATYIASGQIASTDGNMIIDLDNAKIVTKNGKFVTTMQNGEISMTAEGREVVKLEQNAETPRIRLTDYIGRSIELNPKETGVRVSCNDASAYFNQDFARFGKTTLQSLSVVDKPYTYDFASGAQIYNYASQMLLIKSESANDYGIALAPRYNSESNGLAWALSPYNKTDAINLGSPDLRFGTIYCRRIVCNGKVIE